jgi:hypothetical protein
LNVYAQHKVLLAQAGDVVVDLCKVLNDLFVYLAFGHGLTPSLSNSTRSRATRKEFAR